MSHARTAIAAILITATLLVTAACMPLVNHPGKQVADARIERDRFVTSDGVALPLRSWFPANNAPVRAVVIALHGFNDYSNFFASSGIFLGRHGIASYAYDQRGFGGAPGRGLWWGTAAYTGDLASFVKVVRKLHPGLPLYVLGDSMGGAVTIVAMTEKAPPDVDGVILVAPAVWGREAMPWYQRWLLAVASHTVPWMELTGKSLHIVPSDNTPMLRALGRDPLVIKGTRIDTVHGLTDLMDEALLRADQLRLPTLIQYGKNDQIIPKEPVFKVLKKMPVTTRPAIYEQGYHMLLRDLHGEQPLTDIAKWIADPAAPLTYGRNSWR